MTIEYIYRRACSIRWMYVSLYICMDVYTATAFALYTNAPSNYGLPSGTFINTYGICNGTSCTLTSQVPAVKNWIVSSFFDFGSGGSFDISCSADDKATVYIDGQKVCEANGWEDTNVANTAHAIRGGVHIITWDLLNLSFNWAIAIRISQGGQVIWNTRRTHKVLVQPLIYPRKYICICIHQNEITDMHTHLHTYMHTRKQPTYVHIYIYII